MAIMTAIARHQAKARRIFGEPDDSVLPRISLNLQWLAWKSKGVKTFEPLYSSCRVEAASGSPSPLRSTSISTLAVSPPNVYCSRSATAELFPGSQ